uniref:Uncharacterized protein n=1 Tax=Anguilla anguilla TaxID=7936 RepID=A0A0E9SV72_ANGAN
MQIRVCQTAVDGNKPAWFISRTVAGQLRQVSSEVRVGKHSKVR